MCEDIYSFVESKPKAKTMKKKKEERRKRWKSQTRPVVSFGRISFFFFLLQNEGKGKKEERERESSLGREKEM